MGPFPKSKHCEYILVVVNYVSKWVEAMSCRTADAKHSKKMFEETIFLRFRVPRMVISDGGTHFTDKNFHNYLLRHGIRHNIATPYHPQTSGQVETSNKKSRIFCRRQSMRWGLHGRIDYLTHYGLIEWPIKHHLECHHIN